MNQQTNLVEFDQDKVDHIVDFYLQSQKKNLDNIVELGRLCQEFFDSHSSLPKQKLTGLLILALEKVGVENSYIAVRKAINVYWVTKLIGSPKEKSLTTVLQFARFLQKDPKSNNKVLRNKEVELRAKGGGFIKSNLIKHIQRAWDEDLQGDKLKLRIDLLLGSRKPRTPDPVKKAIKLGRQIPIEKMDSFLFDVLKNVPNDAVLGIIDSLKGRLDLRETVEL